MTLLAELPRIERFIYQTLSGDATITGIVANRIYSGAIPQSVTLWPAIVYYPLSAGEDVRGPGPTRIWTAPLYLIKAVSQSASVATLQTLCDRIETLFHGLKGSANGDTIIQFCLRERAFRMTTVEAPGNTIFAHLGGEFRFAASAAVNP